MLLVWLESRNSGGDIGGGGGIKGGSGGSPPRSEGKLKGIKFKLHMPYPAFYTVFGCGLRNVFP